MKTRNLLLLNFSFFLAGGLLTYLLLSYEFRRPIDNTTPVETIRDFKEEDLLVIRKLGIRKFTPQKYATGQLAQIKKALKQYQDHLSIMTFNILFDIFDERTLEKHRWPNRLPRVIKTIQEKDPDIIGLQEPQVNQLNDLKNELKNYAFVDINKEIKKLDPKNNFADAIFYKPTRFKLLNHEIFFASKTPKKPSLHENAKYPTVFLVAKFLDLWTKKEFTLINTHLDFGSPDVREFSAKLICNFAKEKNLIVLGDFNLFANHPSRPLPYYDGDHFELLLDKNCGLIDTRRKALLGHLGPLSTYSNSCRKPTKPFTGIGLPGNFLDRIFVDKSATVLINKTVAKIFSDQSFSSDHFPIYTEIIF